MWDNAATTAFDNAKEALAKATMLIHPRDKTPTALTVDAYITAVGGVLENIINGSSCLFQPSAATLGAEVQCVRLGDP